MMVTFHTNLDLAKPYVRSLDDSIPATVPQKGDRIRFGNTRTFDLEVVARTFHVSTGVIAIELHMTSDDSRSIKEWEAWFTNHMLRDNAKSERPFPGAGLGDSLAAGYERRRQRRADEYADSPYDCGGPRKLGGA